MLERDCFIVLKQLQKEGKILFFLRQIPIHISSTVKYICDFLVFTLEEVLFVEVKGRDLPLGKAKRYVAEELLNIRVHVVHKPTEIYDLVSL